ncbi:circadian clock protein KaiA [Leptolyngbya sp. BL0902]|uniref:circadian clock protein KaiA n=1 Tax=Leptolyngbya sp. BL0902 TaxID=1115757 RepID=UPI0018E7AC17|nr:circadian clock protein KaiA [Leptolyngbya sp. BL0902]QQE65385.1 circadian clock protein KaiA [Leptolyngbya sp. BL0902]
MVAPLQIYILARSRESLAEAGQLLSPDRFVVCLGTTVEESLVQLRDRGAQIDCLVTEDALLKPWLPALAEAGILLPVVVVASAADPSDHSLTHQPWAEVYHSAVVVLSSDHLGQLEAAITRAIQQFLALPASPVLPPIAAAAAIPELLSAQQGRLTDKLKARLGYLGVYYKRNPEYFLRNMSQVDRDALLNQLKIDYRKIVLGYFSNDANLNPNIDAFVNQAFMADVSVSLIVEMHMDLMDEFSKQLKLEGRSEEILLDYRLTLIDVIAHLCEMYRRSIPREP